MAGNIVRSIQSESTESRKRTLDDGRFICYLITLYYLCLFILLKDYLCFAGNLFVSFNFDVGFNF